MTHLELCGVGMGDEGMAALGNLVCRGRLKQLKVLSLGENDGVTDRGVIAFAQATCTRGLPMLKSLHLERLEAATVSVVGIGSIALAVINGCPQLKYFCLRGNSQIFRKLVEGR